MACFVYFSVLFVSFCAYYLFKLWVYCWFHTVRASFAVAVGSIANQSLTTNVQQTIDFNCTNYCNCSRCAGLYPSTNCTEKIEHLKLTGKSGKPQNTRYNSNAFSEIWMEKCFDVALVKCACCGVTHIESNEHDSWCDDIWEHITTDK